MNKNKDIYKEIAFRIKNARQDSKLNQDEFANLIGLTRSSIVNIEKNRQRISIHNLLKISQITGYNMSYFIRGLDNTTIRENKISYNLGHKLHKKIDLLPKTFVLKMLNIYNSFCK